VASAASLLLLLAPSDHIIGALENILNVHPSLLVAFGLAEQAAFALHKPIVLKSESQALSGVTGHIIVANGLYSHHGYSERVRRKLLEMRTLKR
jgi:hypothetical protein